MRLPFVSVLTPTFGRGPDYVWLVAEAVESFLRQDYPAERREMVLLNDTPGQKLWCAAPGVRVVNMPARLPSLGLKRQLLCELAHGEIFCVLDDDDLMRPFHVRQCVERLGDTYGYFNPQRSYWLNHDALHTDHAHGVCHNASAFTRGAAQAAGGYPDESVTEDASMDRRLKASVPVAPPLGNDPASWSHIYRWGISNCHISGGGNPAADWARRGAQTFAPGSYQIQPGYTPRTLRVLGHLLD